MVNTKTRALILGVNGQDGSYLARLLLEKGYEVHGLVRHSSRDNLQNLEGIQDRIIIHKGDLLDLRSIWQAIVESSPDEIYNEADQDNVGWSEETAGYNFDVTGSFVGKILDSIAALEVAPKFFQPLSATMFGSPRSGPQNENFNFNPQSPYACGKVFAYYLCKYYRESCGLDVRTAIFYNHDSPLRTEQYLLPKICYSVARIAKGLQKTLELGNLKQPVDIGYAPEYMEAAWSIMQLEDPDDFVIGSGGTCTIEHIVDTALLFCGLDPTDKYKYIKKHPRFYRESFPILHGDNSKAYQAFGYTPKANIEQIVLGIVTKAKEKYA